MIKKNCSKIRFQIIKELALCIKNWQFLANFDTQKSLEISGVNGDEYIDSCKLNFVMHFFHF